MLDSQQWKRAQAAMPFHLEGDAIPSSRTGSRRSWVSTADGVVDKVDGPILAIAGDEHLTLRHAVPATFDLSALLERRVRVTLLHVATLESGVTQTLTIAGSDGKILLIGHSGLARGTSHRLGSLHVYVALSQRPEGPMVFGTERMQSVVRAGDHVRVRDGSDLFVMHFAARSGGHATYAIGAEELWKGPPSTLR